MNVELQVYRFNHRHTLWLLKHGLGFVVKAIRDLKKFLTEGKYIVNQKYRSI